MDGKIVGVSLGSTEVPVLYLPAYGFLPVVQLCCVLVCSSLRWNCALAALQPCSLTALFLLWLSAV